MVWDGIDRSWGEYRESLRIVLKGMKWDEAGLRGIKRAGWFCLSVYLVVGVSDMYYKAGFKVVI